jgi:hypothetical protein
MRVFRGMNGSSDAFFSFFSFFSFSACASNLACVSIDNNSSRLEVSMALT